MFAHFICLLLIALLSQGFNIEERIPLIKRGPPGSLFGLSITEHYVKPVAQNTEDVVLLVGAPTAEADTYHSADSENPGALFSCKITSNHFDCDHVVIDNARNTLEVNNSNQWLGVTVESEKPGGYVLVCAHRFTVRGGSRNRGIIWEAEVGRCYLLDNHLKPVANLNQWTPCIGKVDPVNGRYTEKYHGYCQAGTSATFADNDVHDLVFGVPGIFTWSGGIQTNELTYDTHHSPLTLWSSELLKDVFHSNDSYLGFSVATGRLYGANMNYISGAPRANHTGMVVILEKNELSDIYNLFELKVKEILFGEVLASSYGYAVKVIDINGDNHDDLIVGAPHYYDPGNNAGGAVYVYMSKGTGQLGPNATTILYGDIDSSFGTSIANLGDINMDGANDIAIGAPGADGGDGSVYIYHGNSDPSIGVTSVPSQVLKASSLRHATNLNISGFGYSISGGLDMDLNGYPDLAVGSLSDMVMLFRTRPIVNVKASINASLGIVNINPEFSPNALEYVDLKNKSHRLVSFNISVCMNYTSIPTSFDEPVDMQYTVKLDVLKLDNDLDPRASFVPLNYHDNIKTTTIRLYPQSEGRTKCQSYRVYLDSDMQDKLTPFVMSLSVDVLNKNITKTVGDKLVPLVPIFNNDVANTLSTQVNISKNCGKDKICKSKLGISTHYVVLPDENSGWQTLEDRISCSSNNSEPIPLLDVGTQKAIGIRVDIDNLGEDAYQATLKVVIPDFLEYINIIDVNAKFATVSCRNSPDNTSLIVCNLGNPLRSNGKILMTLKFGNDRRLYDVQGFVVKMELSTSSVQKLKGFVSFPVCVRVQVQLTVEGYTESDQLFYSGSVVGESAVHVPSDAGLLVEHGYEITNAGSNEVDNVYINVHWPCRSENGKWLFYLLSAEVSGVTGSPGCHVPVELLNPLNLSYSANSRNLSSDSKINHDIIISDKHSNQASDLGPILSQVVLKCPDPLNCIEFSCALGTLLPAQKAILSINAVSWNSTFVEEFFGSPEIRVFSNVVIGVNGSNVHYTKFSVLQSKVATSMFPETHILLEQPVKAWIVVVSLLGGLFLLVIIIILLWYCGFFKRKRDLHNYQNVHNLSKVPENVDDTATDRMLTE